ncbi:MAG: hypothetical protein ABIP29_12555 [Candidatus Eisenbacteria bacterium]
MSPRFVVVGALALALMLAPALAVAQAKARAKAKPTAAASKSDPAAAPAIATLLGKKVTTTDIGGMPSQLAAVAKDDPAKLKELSRAWESQALTGLVLGTLLDRWTLEQKITASPDEVSEMLFMAVQAATSPEAKQAGAPVPDTTNATVRMASAAVVARFKMHAALHKKYGGRVVVDPQAGPLPFDAYRRFLEAEEKAGSFAVVPAWKTRFWAAFNNVDGKQYVPEAEGAVMIQKEWWRDQAK